MTRRRITARVRPLFACLAIVALLTAARAPAIRPTSETFFQDVAFSPDGKRMTLSGLDGKKYAVYSARTNGTDVRAITDTSLSSCWTSWSPDGERIAFAIARGGKGDIFVSAPDGSDVRQLTRDPGNDSERDNPFSSCHPRGDFVDALVNLHYCESFQGIEMTCVDEVGWGVCKRCGVDTMLGCSCNNDDGCGKTADVLG